MPYTRTRNKMKITYYPDPNDIIYNNEAEKILPYMYGNGLDIGCGCRSIDPKIKRLDINPDNLPDIVASMDKIPLPDESLDYIVAQHVFEHIENQQDTLVEWLRVLKKGGFILIIHPDVEYTGIQKPPDDDPNLPKNLYNKHYHERTLEQFIEFIVPLERLGFHLVDSGIAQENWSFYVILRKDKF